MTQWNASPDYARRSYASTPYPSAMPPDDLLTQGVLTRRCLAWFVDLAIIGCLLAALWVVLLAFGMLTLGLGLPLLGVLPALPFCYHFFSLASPMAATPGQALLGLRVLSNNSLTRPEPLQALLSTLAYYVTLSTGGLLLLVAFVTNRKRTLHDLVGGLVVVRTLALTAGARAWNMDVGYPSA